MNRKGAMLGLVGAVFVTGVTWFLPEDWKLPWLAGLLWLTVGLYIGMALMSSDRDAAIQSAVGLGFAGLLLATISEPWFLVLAWLLHPVWDVAHHVGIIKTRIHPLTVPFCIVFDVLVAGAAAAVIQGWL